MVKDEDELANEYKVEDISEERLQEILNRLEND